MKIEFELLEPMYSTYHHYGAGTAIIKSNPTIKNWYLNNAINLYCSTRFTRGYTTPELGICNAHWQQNDIFEIKNYPFTHITGCTNTVIHNLLNDGYYVYFNGVDDYYIKGKTWYKEQHFIHNGLICGYDTVEKTYCIYAYNSQWKYEKFWTPQKCFDQGRLYAAKTGAKGGIWALKPKSDIINFSINDVCKEISKYLDSNMSKYPEDKCWSVYGIVVHEYIAKYLDKLYDGSIPYERMDRRVFRLIWEHKKVVLEIIEKIEQNLMLSDEISNKYKFLVSEADTMRMLYASHHMKRRDAVLPIIKTKLLRLMEEEKKLLSLLIKKTDEMV